MVTVACPDRDRAATIAKELSARGFAQTKVTAEARFRVVSEPLPRSAAESLAATLAGRGVHSDVEALGGDSVHLVFGTLATQHEAETLARRITAAGYDAWVRGQTVYTLHVGPYPQSSINAITGIIKSRASEARTVADPVSPQAPSPPPPSAPPIPLPAPASPPPVAAQGPQGATGESIPLVVSSSSRPAAQAPPQVALRGPSQTASWGLSQGPVATPRHVPAASSTGETAPFLIVPGESLGPVRLGMPVRDQTEGTGAARDSAQLEDGTMMYRWFEPPSNAGVGVRILQDGTVLRVWALNDERYRTKEGLHVGNTEVEVRAALGSPTLIDIDIDRKTRTLVYESLGVWFGIQLDRRYRYYNAVFDIGIMPKK